MSGEDFTCSWWEKARNECYGVVLPLPTPSPSDAFTRATSGETPNAATAAEKTKSAATKPDKVYRPGERLEMQARRLAQKAAAREARKDRDYDALIARVLERF